MPGASSASAEGAVQEARGQEELLAVRNLSLEIAGNLILSDIDMSIRKGEFVCVVGPSGCGKTTLLRVLAGLRQATRGQALYRGMPIARPSREIAIVFQEYTKALLPWRTAAANISLALETMNYPRADRAGRIAELLETVGLASSARKYPSEMSGGMQQRLQIARALALEPSVLLLDEPFGALDAMTRQGLQDEILELVRSTGATAFFVTHDLEEAIYLGDRVIGLHAHPGRVALELEIDLPSPRDQLTTREQPRFLEFRHQLFSFIKGAEGK